MNEKQHSRHGQYLSFELAHEFYGVDILQVQEIRGWQPVREVPDTPGFIKGVIDLRGVIVPVVDLRIRFGMEPAEYGTTTVVIIINVTGQESIHTVGIIVDTVSDVIDVDEAAVKAMPDLGTQIHIDYIRGMAPGETMVMLLDVDKLLAPGELSRLKLEN